MFARSTEMGNTRASVCEIEQQYRLSRFFFATNYSFSGEPTGYLKSMKNFLMACAFIISLCVFGGCNKDDGPSSGAKVSGNFKVDGKKVDLKYGYVYYDGDYTEYSFFDKDMLSYMKDEVEDFEYSSLWVSYDNTESYVDEIGIEYKINYYRESGYYYDYEDYDAYDYVSFNEKNGKVKCSSKSIPVYKYDFDYKKKGSYDASFSVEGKTMDVSDLDDDDYYTRSIEMKEISDPAQVAFFKSLKSRKHHISK